MGSSLYILGILAMAAVVVVLAIGIGGFGAGGEFNRKNGNKMMQLRIFFQFLAVILLLAFVFFTSGGN